MRRQGEGANNPRRNMAAARRRLVVWRRRLLHNGRLKLAALLLAAVFWAFVRTDETVVGQRALRVPLNVEGLAANRAVSGLPEYVEVRVSGPSSRVSALNPGGVDALLDLRGVTGAFEQPVRVFLPQGLTVVWTRPAELLGTVETREEKTVPVRAVTFGAGPDDTLSTVTVSPAEVVVGGAEGQMARVTQALVPVDLGGAEAQGRAYAADAKGSPVAGVTLTTGPDEASGVVALELTRRPVLATRELPLLLEPLTFAGAEVVSATLERENVSVVGPSAALEELEAVLAGLPETLTLAPGQYTLDVALALPEGVTALSTPQVTVRLRALPPPPETN